MAWQWRYENGHGGPAVADVQVEEFANQSDAESWLGEHWRVLLDSGVDRVSLVEDDGEVYSTLDLHEAADAL